MRDMYNYVRAMSGLTPGYVRANAGYMLEGSREDTHQNDP
jgi:hypothetical protein